MAAVHSLEDTAKIILDAVVAGPLGMRSGEVRKYFNLRARALERGVHMDDFVPGLERAVEEGWFEPADSGFFRLTEAGFAAASNPSVGSPVASTLNISSEGQFGGITAHTVNIAGGVPAAPPPLQPAQGPSWWDSWWNRIGIGAGILVAVYAVVDHYGGKPQSVDLQHTIEAPPSSSAQSRSPQNVAPSASQLRQPDEPSAPHDPPAAPATVIRPKSSQHQHTAAMKQPPNQQDAQPQASSPQPGVQQQVNVSSQNQSGGITAGTVNIYGQRQQRHLDQRNADFLMQHIPKSAKVAVTAVMGDSEAFTYAQEITSWLHNNGWTNVDGVSQAIFSGPVFGQTINPNKDGSFDIQIGNQR